MKIERFTKILIVTFQSWVLGFGSSGQRAAGSNVTVVVLLLVATQ